MLIDGAKLDSPAAPLGDLLRLGLGIGPKEVAILSNKRALSRRELEEASSRVAAGYLGLGLEPGDRVASLMPNRVDLVVHYLACFKAGLIATPLNYRYTAAEIDHALGVSGARVLLAHVERATDIAASESAPRLDLGTIAYRDAEPLPQGNEEPGADHAWDHDFAGLLAAQPLPRAADAEPDDPAVIFFTSGSTGPAKGVTHTRESLRWMIAGAAMAFELSAEDVFLPGSSMSHVGGFLWSLATLSVGGRVVVARATDAHELLPLLREQQPTVLAMIPAALSALIHDHDLRPGDFLAADLPGGRRQGLDRAARRVRRGGGLPDRRGLRDDRGRPGDAEPALGRDPPGLDRHPDRRLPDRTAE